MNKKHFIFCFWAIAILCCASCGEDVYTPKPRGFFRLDVKDTAFQPLRGNYPYSFEYSQAAFVDSLYPKGEHWINLIYPELNSILFITYKTVDDTNLLNLIDDSRTLVYKQIKRVDDILESSIVDTSAHLYGKIYEATGNDAACPFQFWVTDRENHFFRASLYLNNKPQNDSLSPVITYLKKDMMHLIETFAWR
ncbi:MAG: hypothetical protein LBH82_01645 [Bacteroidales bacterium]|jgi:gliding motility-associated lipoprotein GldD|nr:hypothetical protein [Bacteroidales bacterium]